MLKSFAWSDVFTDGRTPNHTELVYPLTRRSYHPVSTDPNGAKATNAYETKDRLSRCLPLRLPNRPRRDCPSGLLLPRRSRSSRARHRHQHSPNDLLVYGRSFARYRQCMPPNAPALVQWLLARKRTRIHPVAHLIAFDT